MRLFYVATVGCLFSMPFYIMWCCKPPASIAIAFSIWCMLLIFFWSFFDDKGRFCG